MQLFVDSFKSFHLPHSFSRHMGLLFLTAATSGDAPRTIAEFIKVAHHSVRLVRHAKSTMKSASLIAAEIDERLDPLDFETISRSGSITFGSEACEFIKNPNIITASDWELWNSLDRNKIIPNKVLIPLGNLMAYHLVGEKSACEEVKTNESKRNKAKDHHLNLSSICACAISTVLNPLTQQTLKETNITYQSLQTVCPDAVILGEVVQWHDDLTDTIKDLRNEHNTGTPTPNAFLTNLYNANALDTFQDYCLNIDPSSAPRFEPARQLPNNVLTIWQKTIEHTHEQTSTIKHQTAQKCTHRLLKALPGPFIK